MPGKVTSNHTGVWFRMQIESRRQDALGDAPTFFQAGLPAQGDFLCAGCGYGVNVRSLLPECPMCRGDVWEEPTASPYSPPPL